MKIFSFLDKLFDITAKVESTIEEVSKRTRLTIEKIVRDITRTIFNMFVFYTSILLVLAGLILWLSKYLPLELILIFFGLLGFLIILLQKLSIRIK